MKPSWRTPRAGIATVAVGLSCLVLAAPAAAISGNAGGADASAAQYLAPSGSQVPASAPSQSPSEGQVTPLGEETPVDEAAPGETAVLPATPIASESAGLPFTGYVLLGIIFAGLVALLIGLLMRRFTTWRLS